MLDTCQNDAPSGQESLVDPFPNTSTLAVSPLRLSSALCRDRRVGFCPRYMALQRCVRHTELGCRTQSPGETPNLKYRGNLWSCCLPFQIELRPVTRSSGRLLTDTGIYNDVYDTRNSASEPSPLRKPATLMIMETRCAPGGRQGSGDPPSWLTPCLPLPRPQRSLARGTT